RNSCAGSSSYGKLPFSKSPRHSKNGECALLLRYTFIRMAVTRENRAGLPRTIVARISQAHERAANSRNRALSAVRKSKALISQSKEIISDLNNRRMKRNRALRQKS